MQEEKQYGMTTGESAQNVDPSSEQYQSQESPSGKKKSVMGKVRDKAKKFKSKMKVKKPDSGDGGSSSSDEEEEDSDQTPVSSESPGVQNALPDEKKDRGFEDEKSQSPPAPVDMPATYDVEERLGKLNLGPKSRGSPQDSVPATAADTPVEEGKDSHGRDLTIDQESVDPSKIEGPAGVAGVEALSQHETPQSGHLARDTSEKDTIEGEKQTEGQSQATITTRAANTVYGLKDTLASKLGYGASSPTDPSAITKQTPDDSKPSPVTTRAANTVIGLKDTVASKLGYGTGSSPTGTQSEETTPDEANAAQKSYLQKVQDTAYGAKDAVASKLGYNVERSEASKVEQYESPSRFHPGLEDKALSTIITDAMSNSATTVKNSVMGSFGGSNTASPKPSSPPPPPESTPSDVAK